MTKDAEGSDVGLLGVSEPVKKYKKGEVYEVGESLAKDFCDDLKVAERVSAPKKEAPKSKEPAGKASKALSGAPENKARKGR